MLAWGLLFIVLSNFFSIYKVQFIGRSVNVIQDVLTDKHISTDSLMMALLSNAATIICCSVLSGLFTFMMRQTIIVTSRRIEYELKNKIYTHYQDLSLTTYKKNTVGDLMNRLSEDVGAVRMYMGPGVMYVTNLSILLIVTSIYMSLTDLRITIQTLLPLPILSFVIYKVSSIINRKSKIVQKSQSEISTFVQDSFSGIRVIKFFNKEIYIKKNYNYKVKNYMLKALDLAKTEAWFYTIILFVIGLLSVNVLYIGGEQYINGKTSIGTIADFFMYINILIWPFSMVGWVTSVNQRAEASMQRINEFLNIKSEIKNTNNKEYQIYGDIEFRNVSYTYPNNGIQALKNVSFKVKAGESLAIMGKTGSGKTTIALLLCRLLEPDSGDIFVDGKNLKDHNLNVYRENIGFVPQESYLFSDTIKNNIGFALDNPTKSTIEEFSKIADIHKDIIGFNKKYDTIVGERGVMLSGGQKQRICIARALIKKPKILIFDDSLSALDTETEENILQNIKLKINKNTSIIITHRESSAKNAHSILHLKDGLVSNLVRPK